MILFLDEFFSDEKLCKKLIEILLHIKIDSLKIPPEYQKTFQSGISAKGVRFDIYTETKDKAFDIEIQTTKQKKINENFLLSIRK